MRSMSISIFFELRFKLFLLIEKSLIAIFYLLLNSSYMLVNIVFQLFIFFPKEDKLLDISEEQIQPRPKSERNDYSVREQQIQPRTKSKRNDYSGWEQQIQPRPKSKATNSRARSELPDLLHQISTLELYFNAVSSYFFTDSINYIVKDKN